MIGSLEVFSLWYQTSIRMIDEKQRKPTLGRVAVWAPCASALTSLRHGVCSAETHLRLARDIAVIATYPSPAAVLQEMEVPHESPLGAVCGLQ